MKCFVYLIIFFLFSQCKPTEVATGPSQAPNIIFILADDLGYGDVEILNKQSKISTPHLNKLAQQGMIFTQAHVQMSEPGVRQAGKPTSKAVYQDDSCC